MPNYSAEDFEQLEKYLCAVTQKVMHTPVLLECCNNHVDATVITNLTIEEDGDKNACPCCNDQSTLSDKRFKFDEPLKERIKQFLATHPGIVKEYTHRQNSTPSKPKLNHG